MGYVSFREGNHFSCQVLGGKMLGCLLDVCWEGPAASGDMSFKEAPGPAGGKHDREICFSTWRKGMKKEASNSYKTLILLSLLLKKLLNRLLKFI